MTADGPGARVVVVGGGVAGLVVARDLARAGVRVTVLESSAHLGGCVGPLTVRRGGIDGAPPPGDDSPFTSLTLDGGAESFATRSPAVATLVSELGLARDVVHPPATPAWVRSAHVSAPLPRSGVLGIPGSLDEVRRTLGTAAWLRARLDSVLPASVGTGVRRGRPVSVGHLVRTRLGRGVLRTFVAPVAGGVHSADPDLLDVDAVAPGLRAGVATHGSLVAAAAHLRSAAPAGSAVAGLRGGVHRIVAALADDVRAHGGTVVTSARVERLRRDGDGWALTVVGPAAPGTMEAALGADALIEEHADHVVVAASAVAARDLVGPLLPGTVVPAPPVRGGINLVTLVVDAPALDAAPRGTGVLVADGTAAALGIRAKALTHASAKWAWVADALPPGHHAVRLSYGHLGETPDAADASATSLERTALHDAGLLLATPLTPADVVGCAVVRFPSGLPFASVGHAARVARVRADVAALPGLDVTGAWVAGTGLTAVVTDARRTAQAVLAAVATPGAHAPHQPPRD